jgi:methionyl-tRNA synthetase
MFVTTAISYLNGDPHMGHQLEIVASDIITRYHKVKSKDFEVIFQTGSDEHGQKIAEKAKSLELEPIELCNQNVVKFMDLYSALGINYDLFIRTSDPVHYKTVQHVFNLLKERGDIYLGKYVGWYSSREEKYVTELQAKKTEYLDEVTGKPLEKIEEESYFFKMSRFQSSIVKFYQDNPEFVSSKIYYNQILKRLEEPLQDLSISRSNFKWGVPLEGEHVCYVWFDALLNYVSGIDYFNLDPGNPYHGKGQDIWKNTYHVIGKDITWFHGVIWPAMLMALEIPLPKQLVVHGFVTDSKGIKMSKSLGNVIDPFDLLKQIPIDTLRFYTVRFSNLENDSKCGIDDIVEFHNGELANNVGNLVNRVVNLINKSCKSVVPVIEYDDNVEEMIINLLKTDFIDKLNALYKSYAFRDISQLILDLFHQLNQWLQEKEPWKIKDNKVLKEQILRIALERLYQISHTLIPIVPNIATTIFNLINMKPLSYEELRKLDCQSLDMFDNLSLEKQKIILFPKIEL